MFVHSVDPEFSSASVENIAGKLNVLWGFRHTGGAPLIRVMVSCVSTDEKGSGDGGLTVTVLVTACVEMLALMVWCRYQVDQIM